MKLFRPRITPAIPGVVAPITSNPGAARCARYQVIGFVLGRCGSLARTGPPFSHFSLDTIHIFDPTPSPMAPLSSAATVFNISGKDAELALAVSEDLFSAGP